MITLQITTHSGDSDTVEVDEYDAESIASEINNNEINVVVIADNIYSRIDIKNIRVVESVK